MFLLLAACSGDATGPMDTGSEPVATGDTSDPIRSTATTADTGTAVDPCPPSLEIGGGATAHVPLVGGGDVMIVHGPQGGWHIETSGRVAGLGPTVQVLPTVTRTSDGLQIAGDQQPTGADLTPAGAACTGDFFGIRAFVDDASATVPYQEFICSLADDTFELTVEVTDLATGEGVVERLPVTARLDPVDIPSCP